LEHQKHAIVPVRDRKSYPSSVPIRCTVLLLRSKLLVSIAALSPTDPGFRTPDACKNVPFFLDQILAKHYWNVVRI
jgi:hypothetical protein